MEPTDWAAYCLTLQGEASHPPVGCAHEAIFVSAWNKQVPPDLDKVSDFQVEPSDQDQLGTIQYNKDPRSVTVDKESMGSFTVQSALLNLVE